MTPLVMYQCVSQGKRNREIEVLHYVKEFRKRKVILVIVACLTGYIQKINNKRN